ncbi:MAG: hypothetical protein ACPID3_06310 [Paracoccaceae bacterium]
MSATDLAFQVVIALVGVRCQLLPKPSQDHPKVAALLPSQTNAVTIRKLSYRRNETHLFLENMILNHG